MRDGKFTDNDKLKLVIQSQEVADKAEYNNIVRKTDNNFHGSAGQAAVLLENYGLKLEITPLPRKKWTMILSAADDNSANIILEGLKLYSQMLTKKYGVPGYNGAWKLKGDAFKYFEKADFNKL